MVIKDNWKLQVEEYSQKQWLFNLADDPTEQLELSDKHPEKVYELMALINQHSEGAQDFIYKPPLLANVDVDRNLKEAVEEGHNEDEESVWVTN